MGAAISASASRMFHAQYRDDALKRRAHVLFATDGLLMSATKAERLVLAFNSLKDENEPFLNISAFKAWFPELQRRFTQSILFDGLWKLGGADDDGNLDPKGFITLIELICSASKAELFYLVFERLASRLTHTGVALVDIDHLKATYPSFEIAKRDPEPNINRVLRTAMETALRDRDYEERRHEAVRKRDVSRGMKPSTPPSLRVPQQEKTQLRWKEWMELQRQNKLVLQPLIELWIYIRRQIFGNAYWADTREKKMAAGPEILAEVRADSDKLLKRRLAHLKKEQKKKAQMHAAACAEAKMAGEAPPSPRDEAAEAEALEAKAKLDVERRLVSKVMPWRQHLKPLPPPKEEEDIRDVLKMQKRKSQDLKAGGVGGTVGGTGLKRSCLSRLVCRGKVRGVTPDEPGVLPEYSSQSNGQVAGGSKAEGDDGGARRGGYVVPEWASQKHKGNALPGYNDLHDDALAFQAQLKMRGAGDDEVAVESQSDDEGMDAKVRLPGQRAPPKKDKVVTALDAMRQLQTCTDPDEMQRLRDKMPKGVSALAYSLAQQEAGRATDELRSQDYYYKKHNVHESLAASRSKDAAPLKLRSRTADPFRSKRRQRNTGPKASKDALIQSIDPNELLEQAMEMGNATSPTAEAAGLNPAAKLARQALLGPGQTDDLPTNTVSAGPSSSQSMRPGTTGAVVKRHRLSSNGSHLRVMYTGRSRRKQRRQSCMSGSALSKEVRAPASRSRARRHSVAISSQHASLMDREQELDDAAIGVTDAQGLFAASHLVLPVTEGSPQHPVRTPVMRTSQTATYSHGAARDPKHSYTPVMREGTPNQGGQGGQGQLDSSLRKMGVLSVSEMQTVATQHQDDEQERVEKQFQRLKAIQTKSHSIGGDPDKRSALYSLGSTPL